MKIKILLIFTLITTNIFAQPFTNYKIVKSKNVSKSAVVSAHPFASEAGNDIMGKGGNAFDAAIATQLALAVVYPGAGNIGGGGFMVAVTKTNKQLALDYRETAPSKSTRDMYLNKNGNVINGLSENGHLAAGIPGTIAGLFETHKYALLSFSILIQPAINLAEKGFAITKREADNLNGNKVAFLKYNSNTKMAFIKNTDWNEGDILVQKDLAETLKRIKLLGSKGFYEGKTAQLIVAEMKRGNGIIALNDLKKYKAVWKKPQTFKHNGFDIVGMPLPSSGGIILHQLMYLVEKMGIKNTNYDSANYVQMMVEAERIAYKDRAIYLGDPLFVKVPVKTLTSDNYLNTALEKVNLSVAGISDTSQKKMIPESEETTHLSVIDNFGNAVSVTTTLNGGYGSKTVVGGGGFLLNNEMDDFSVKPGVPNMYGAYGAEANAIEPNKRMLSSMTPTIVLKNNKPIIVIGTPGGTTIPTSVFQALVNIIYFNKNASDAINLPKFHHQWLPDVVFVENDFPETKILALKKLGYKVEKRGAIGRTEIIMKARNNTWNAVADKRGDDAVSGN